MSVNDSKRTPPSIRLTGLMKRRPKLFRLNVRSLDDLNDVRLRHLADIPMRSADVRFWGQNRHCLDIAECPLLTQSGHWQPEFAVMHNAAHSMLG